MHHHRVHFVIHISRRAYATKRKERTAVEKRGRTEGEGGGEVVTGGRNGEKKGGQDRSKMGSHSPGPFLLYGGKVLYVLPCRTVDGKVYAAPLQNHSSFVVYIFDAIGELDWVPGLEAN